MVWFKKIQTDLLDLAESKQTKMEKLKPVLKFLLATVFIVSSLTGVYRFVVFSGENKCEMTYMYEYPQYIKIPLEENGNNSYALYVYGEGELAERYQKTQFTGIPVLFVPGNSGSHKQVRSLASVAYRKHLDSRTKFHFDFFAVDFNEELTAVYGGHLEDQVRFVKTSISKILKLYNSSKQPTSVIIVGHSMGGMVAKGLFLENDFDKNSVRTVITLATPHRSPVVATDPYIVRFYEKVNHYWASLKNADVVFASVGGAVRDVQVRSGLTTAHDPAINTLTTAIPGVWLSTDHLCLVWCKQVVLTLTRALFDIVDPKTRQPREDTAFRESIFRYHLTNRFGGKHFQPSTVPREVKFDEEGEWREVIASQFVMDHNMNSGQIRNTYFMIPLLDNPHKNLLVAVAKRLGVRDWVFGCVASSWRGAVRICDKGINLSDQTVLLPSMGDNVKRKSLHVDLAKLKADGYSHLVFNLPRAEPRASVALDIHRSSDRDLVYRFSLLSYLNLFKPSVVAQSPAGSLSYNLTFPDFTKSWQAFQILVEPLSSAKKCRALIRKTVPWNRAESEFFLAVNRTVSVQADIQLHAPKTLMDQEDQFLKLEIISVPGCEYSILMKFDWIGSWSQIFRFYPSVVVSLFCAILLDCLSRQLLARSRGGQTPSVLTALSRLSFRRVFLVPELVSLGLGFLDAWQLNIPLADDYALRTEGLGLPLLLFILGIPAWTLCFLVVLVLHAAVVFGGNTLHLFVVRYLGGSLGVGSIITEIVCLGLNKFPFVIAVALTAISYSTCGAVGLLFGLIVCIWKLFQIYEEQLEDFITESGDAESKDEESSESTLNILSTITVLWLCVTLLNIPSLLAWLKYSNNALDKDPSFWTSVVVCLGAGVLWRDNFESKHANRLKFVAVIAWLSSLCVLLFGLTSIYRISYFIAVPIAVLALSQLV